MFKALAVSALVASAYAHIITPLSTISSKFLADQWPDVIVYKNFKISVSVNTENEFKALIPYFGMDIV